MRLIFLSWLLLITLTTILLGQAFHLQVVEGKSQARRAEQNRFRIQAITPPRGVLYDHTGKALVEQQNQKRRYLFPEELAHVVGYLGEADEKELVLFGVEPGSWVGKLGLERAEDGMLRGKEGGAVEEFSATGELVRTLSRTEPVPGRSLQLSIDLALQQKAYQLLKDSKFRGAVVVSTIDGKLLALASVPSYDPNLFLNLQGHSDDPSLATQIQSIFDNPAKPMFNRAIAGLYPPASTFKIIAALGALEQQAITKSTLVEDTGAIQVGKFRFGTWYFDQYGRKEGVMNLVHALRRSNDIFFYKTGEQLGIEALAKWARVFGLGSVTGVPLIGEVPGLVPDRQWKQAAKEEAWFLGDTYITSIGQGNLQVTPIQVHRLMTSVANHGKLCTPSLILAGVDGPPNALDPIQVLRLNECTDLPVAQVNLALVKKGLQEACEPGGTGWPLFKFKVKSEKLKVEGLIDGVNYIHEASSSAEVVRIPVACKTGTAETGRSTWEDGKEKHLTHAWMTAFAPVEDPEIVVTVLLEDAGQGSDKAGPVVREILKAWFGRE